MLTTPARKAAVSADHIPVWDDAEEAIYHKVEIDLELCDGCKLCTAICAANVLELYGKKGDLKCRVKEDFQGCMSCNNCYAICAPKAIRAAEPYDFAGYYEQKRIGGFAFPRKF